jgi:UDP-2,4-diacetamido-2,4,6-trideoxy-beta-L-altropyranose hydrolase
VSEEDELYEQVRIESPHILFIDKLYEYTPEFINNIQMDVKVIMFHNICEGGFLSSVFILPAAHVSDDVLKDSRWISGGVELYHGYEYVIVNKGLISANRRKLPDREAPNIVITTGGSDPAGVLIKILMWLPEAIEVPFTVTALVGEAFLHWEELNSMEPLLGSNIQIKAYDVEELTKASFAIATFGVSSYELLYLNIPFLSVGHSLRNAEGSRNLSLKCSSLIDLGYIEVLEKESFQIAFNDMLTRYDKLENTGCIVDGKGVERIAKIILETTP